MSRLDNCQKLADSLFSDISFIGRTMHELPNSNLRNDMDTDQEKLGRLLDTLNASQKIARTVFNARSPINRLPIEILVYILKILPQNHWDEGLLFSVLEWSSEDAFDEWCRPKYWIGLLHVCQYWRRVMLASPTLWSTIVIEQGLVLSPKKVFSFMLDHAGAHPLRVFVPDGALSLLSPHVARLQELRVRCTYPKELRALNRPAPLLEYLDISVERPNSERDLPMFANSTPHLRRLALDNFNWLPQNYFSTLTHLYLSGCQESQPSRERSRRFLQMLASNPGLEDLFLEPHHLVAGMHAFGDGAKPVELPRLKRFCIRTIAAAQVTQIISHLTLPPGLCISVVGVEQNGTSFDGILFPFFKDNTLIRPLQDITAVEIDVFADDMDLTTVANGVGTSGAFHTDYSEEDSEDYFDASIQSLAMLNLKELWITGRRPWEDEPRPGITPWRVFNELKLLEKLVIQHSTSLSDIIDSLFPNYDPSSESRDPSAETETPPVPSPHLHCLWITGSPESLTTASTHLVACVSERHYRIGPSLREIRLRSHIDIEDDQAAHWSGSTSYQECIPDLRQYVADVEDVSVLPVGIELPEATQTPYFRGSRMKWPRWRSEHVSGWEEPSKPCE